MNTHVQRWITGIIAVPLLLLIVWYGSEEVFAAFIAIVAVAAFYEYNELVFGEGVRWEKWAGMVIAFLVPSAAFMGDGRLLLSAAAFSVLGIFVLFLLHIIKNKHHPFDINSLAKLVLGVMYIPFMLSHLILLRRSDDGILWIFFILVLAFCGDIAAFYVGKTMGKRKLIPEVSPGKTVEGTVALIIGSMAGCALFAWLFFPSLPLIQVVILGFVGSIIGQLGDLFESAIKRAADVKDSSSILMGHGGLLDRLDCLVFIIPFVYYYKAICIR
jgi:phosphatidate cytidylyltransferase